MTLPLLSHVLIVGAGAAGLMTARQLARAGRRVTVLEARERCGGRIWGLPAADFGYPAEAGAEFVHGAAPVTRGLMREAGLSLQPRGGARWSTRTGSFQPAEAGFPDEAAFYDALREVESDLPIAEFLDARFSGPGYEALRRSVTRTVEGYDAADPHRASTLALREEWLARDDGQHGRVAEGYSALIDFLAADCRRHGGAIRFGAAVTAIEENAAGIVAVHGRGERFAADAAVLAVPLPVLFEIAVPAAVRERVASATGIGFGNVVKLLLRFDVRWWAHAGGRDLADLSFLASDAAVPTWWTQYPRDYPVLTGWYAGPKADRVAALTEADLVEMGVASLAEIFALPADGLRRGLVAGRAINWGIDPFARGAYSYATPQTRAAQAALTRSDGGRFFFSGEALHAGPDIGTVEAAFAIGKATAEAILSAGTA